jgi:ubiquinone/menaquinone biosynthesis C-methylase UbiE
MLMKEAAFDILAPAYDEAFSHTLVGLHQRAAVRRYLQAFISGYKRLNILEINCGTGDDALWLAAQGHNVVATDASGMMIEKALEKQPSHESGNVQFLRCGFGELESRFGENEFDLIFSNFSGLNCVSAAGLKQLAPVFHRLLKNEGRLAFVVFGKYTLWEMTWYLSKFQFREAFRRWGKSAVAVTLKNDSVQEVFYHSISEMRRNMKGFRLVKKRPVGLWVPPSYMDAFVQKRAGLFRWLSAKEKRSGSWPFLSPFADHTYLLFKKEEA